MTAYFALLFLVFSLCLIAKKYKPVKSIFNTSVSFIGIVLILFAGIRDVSVGADTSAYANRFAGNEVFFDQIFFDESSMEIGYRILEWLAYFFSQNYSSLLILVAAFIVIFQLKSIFQISISPIISIFALITFGFFTFSFNGMRQGIALAIYLFSLQYLISGEFKKYSLYIILAFFFHKTVIIMLPMYFVFRIKFSFRTLLLFIVTTTLIIQFFDNLLDLSLLISNKYAVYKEMNATGGQLLTISHLLLSTFFILSRKLINKKLYYNYDIFLNMFLIGTIIYVVVQITGAYVEITRLAAYFLISLIFLWALLLNGIMKGLTILYYLIFIVSSLSFYTIYLIKIGNLVPYNINEIFQ